MRWPLRRVIKGEFVFQAPRGKRRTRPRFQGMRRSPEMIECPSCILSCTFTWIWSDSNPTGRRNPSIAPPQSETPSLFDRIVRLIGCSTTLQSQPVVTKMGPAFQMTNMRRYSRVRTALNRDAMAESQGISKERHRSIAALKFLEEIPRRMGTPRYVRASDRK